MQIISIGNQKGGVGKTTTAVSLAAGLRKKGQKVLLIDLDPQANATSCSYDEADEWKWSSTYDLLLRKEAASDIINKTFVGDEESYDIIMANTSLAGFELDKIKEGKEYRLKEALEPIKKKYDYIIIDTPPALGSLTINALIASNSLIIPAQAGAFSVQGIAEIVRTVEAVKKESNKKLIIQGVLQTRHNPRAVISRLLGLDLLDNTDIEYIMHLSSYDLVYNTHIRECIALTESQEYQTNIFDRAPKSNGAIDYMNLVDEVIERSNFKNFIITKLKESYTKEGLAELEKEYQNV